MRYLLLVVLLASCVSRKEVEADIWLVKKIPANLCPSGVNHGFYRRIVCEKPTQHKLCNGGQAYYIERVSFCSGRAEEMLGMKREDAVKWLEEFTKPER